jgi:uncharacterized coiled-coil DUF342 family protein
MPEINIFSTEAAAAGGAAIVGGIFFKLIEKLWLSKTVVDEHAVLRKELREELDAVKDEIASLRDEVDEWREKYYSQVETTNELLFEVSVLKTRLRKYESDSGEFNQDDF